MISIKYDCDAKHDFKNPKAKVETKHTCTFEAEWCMGVLLDLILKYDEDENINVERVFKEVETIYSEIIKSREEN